MKELIVDFLEKQGITKFKTLKRGTEIMFRCPFHADSSSSLEMNTVTGVFICYGCQKKGSFKTFIKLLTGEEVDMDKVFPLEMRVTSKIKFIYEQSARNILQYDDRVRFLEYCNEEFTNFVDISKSEEATNYLKGQQRKLNDETIKFFKLKYAIRGEYEGRIIIPYYKNQSLVGFNARLIGVNKQHGKDDRYRYCINHKDFAGYIYNIENVNKNKPVFLVEGPFDLMWLWQNGYKNVVSTLNTSIKAEHLENLIDFNTFVFVFDNDRNSSGYKAVLRGSEIILKFFPTRRVYYAHLPSEKDPNECTQAELSTSFKQLKRIIIKDDNPNI